MVTGHFGEQNIQRLTSSKLDAELSSTGFPEGVGVPGDPQGIQWVLLLHLSRLSLKKQTFQGKSGGHFHLLSIIVTENPQFHPFRSLFQITLDHSFSHEQQFCPFDQTGMLHQGTLDQTYQITQSWVMV